MWWAIQSLALTPTVPLRLQQTGKECHTCEVPEELAEAVAAAIEAKAFAYAVRSVRRGTRPHFTSRGNSKLHGLRSGIGGAASLLENSTCWLRSGRMPAVLLPGQCPLHTQRYPC